MWHAHLARDPRAGRPCHSFKLEPYHGRKFIDIFPKRVLFSSVSITLAEFAVMLKIPRFKLMRATILIAAVALAVVWVLSRNSVHPVLAQTFPYRNFEAPQVHPLTMTPDGTRLLAVNTPNATLSVFYVTGKALTLMAEIP